MDEGGGEKREEVVVEEDVGGVCEMVVTLGGGLLTGL